MKKSEMTHISKYFSLVLRHKPSAVGICLDYNGWVAIDELIDKTTSMPLTHTKIEEVVLCNDKQRFAIEERDGVKYIRANQGHSIDVDLELGAVVPPDILYHGTVHYLVNIIEKNGINKQKRHHVHMSDDEETAKKVGARHGVPAILRIDAHAMYEDGIEFYKSVNGVWLTDFVETIYFSLLKGK
jgi:putative RNA 2'-phosphotransferase